MQPDSVLQAHRRAVADARAAEPRRVRLDGNNGARRNSSIRLHKHPKFTDIPGGGPEHMVSLAVAPDETNRTVDGKAGVQSPVDTRWCNGRSRL
jgi:hypothetical protein